MSNRLARLEAQIEQWIEGSLARLLAGRLQAREVAIRLARAMEDHALPGVSGERLAPTRYRIRLHPDDAAALQSEAPDLVNSLTDELLIFARELDLTFPASPTISIEPDAAVEPNGVFVVAASDPKSETQPMPATANAEPASVITALPKAYLIVEGDKHVPLNRAVITLGRRLDNTIILDDPRVSRHHAQLRQRYGRWLLYDLGSASGTYVNNHRIDECVLRAGDVIALAGVMLIYGEEETATPDDTGHTAPLANRPASAEPRLKDE
jgi:hypothetical protein